MSEPILQAQIDAVISQFGFMFFSDRREALRQALRVLAPGGCLTVAVWDALDKLSAYLAEVMLLERLAGRQAADALRAPFALGDRQALVAQFEEAGVAAVEATTDQGSARFPARVSWLKRTSGAGYRLCVSSCPRRRLPASWSRRNGSSAHTSPRVGRPNFAPPSISSRGRSCSHSRQALACGGSLSMDGWPHYWILREVVSILLIGS